MNQGDVKYCLYCYEPLERNEGETYCNWKMRMYCGKKHSSLHREEMKPKKRSCFNIYVVVPIDKRH